MREIKFRVWTGLEMEYRVVVGNLGAFYASGIDPTDSACIGTTTLYHKETPVMQYTGLKDKKGKEIYEGDILKHHKYDLLLKVIWNQDSCGWQAIGDQSFFLSKLCSPYIEIIGNIYENGELLNNRK